MTHSPQKRTDDTGVGVRVNGLVNAAEVYYPTLVTTPWFKTWSLKCGYCQRKFVRFTLFGKPCCPHCGTRNHLNFTMYM